MDTYDFKEVVRDAIKKGITADEIAAKVTEILNEETNGKDKLLNSLKDSVKALGDKNHIVTFDDAAAVLALATYNEHQDMTKEELSTYYNSLLKQMPIEYKLYNISDDIYKTYLKTADKGSSLGFARPAMKSLFDLLF